MGRLTMSSVPDATRWKCRSIAHRLEVRESWRSKAWGKFFAHIIQGQPRRREEVTQHPQERLADEVANVPAHCPASAPMRQIGCGHSSDMAAGAPHSSGVPALATAATSTTQSAAAGIKRIPHPPRADADDGEYAIKHAVQMSRTCRIRAIALLLTMTGAIS
jgi:hypothetical protein